MDNGLDHITAAQRSHINELASRKVSPINMNPKKYAYILLGHGGDSPLEKIKVPNGCIVVIKAHVGDKVDNIEFNSNIISLTNIYNKDIILNPNANKEALFRLLNNKGNLSVAIYNEKEEINNLFFQPLGFFEHRSLIQTSGTIKIDSRSPELEDMKYYTTDGQAFSKNDDTWVLNTIEGNNIWDIFVNTSMYDYYYSRKNIEDICNAYTYLANVKQDSPESSTKIKSEFNDTYANLIRIPRSDDRSVLEIMIELIDSIFDLNTSDLHFNTIATALQNCTLNQLLSSIQFLTQIRLSTIFEDINNGLIKPGVIYNVACRSIDTSNSDIMVKASKNSVGEAEVHRKNQLRQVANRLQVNTSNEYKQYAKNSKKSESYTYKKGNNSKWQRYKKGYLYNTKKKAKPADPKQGLIHTSENQKNYIMVNGKWKTRKWNARAQKYLEENNALTRKNANMTNN
jgi:hypothetical protein